MPLRALLFMAMAAFSGSINLRVCDPLLPQIARDFSASVGQASAIVTAFAVGYGLLQLLFGPLGDRFGKYRVAAITSVLTGLATALSALSPSLDGLIATRFIAGACAAAAIPLAFAWIGDAVPFARRQAVLARFLSAQISGIILGQAAGGVLGDLLGWRWVFVIIGALHAIAGTAMLLELARNPRVNGATSARRLGIGAVAASLAGLVARPWVRVVWLTVFVEAFAFYGAFAYIGADLHHRFGLGFALVGTVMATYGGGAIVYAVTARHLLAGFGERGLVLAGGVALSGGYVALAFAPTVAAVPLIMVGLGLGFYMFHNTLQTNATQMAPEQRGLGVSLFAFGLFLGQSLGVALAAPVVDRWGTPIVYVAAAAILPVVALWFRARLAGRPAG